MTFPGTFPSLYTFPGSSTFPGIPGWPRMDYGVCWAAGPSQSPVQDHWLSLTNRTKATTTVKRGKQYELDQVQPGEMTLTLRNDDGAFDSDNTSSPYSPWVIPYRLIRLRAQYPATANLLDPAQATPTGATLPPHVTVPVFSWSIGPTGGGGLTYPCIGVQGPSALTQPQVLLNVTGWSAKPGVTYSGQYGIASAANGPPNPPDCALRFEWFDVNGAHLSYSTVGASLSPAYATPAVASCSATAPANACGMSVQIVNTSTTASSWGIVAYHPQVEEAAAPTTYAPPGTWYNLFTGYVERWPQSWTSAGNYGASNLTVVDLFTFFANHALNYPAYQEVLALNPTFLYPLDEAQAAIYFHNVTPNRQQMTKRVSPNGKATQVAPGAALAATGATNTPIGIPGPLVGFNNAGAGAAVLDLSTIGTIGPPSGPWTRTFAVNVGTAQQTQYETIWWAGMPGAAAGPPTGTFNNITPGTGTYYHLFVYYDPSNPTSHATGYVAFAAVQNGVLLINSGVLTFIKDGTTHLITVSHDGVAGHNLVVCVDGVNLGGPATPSPLPNFTSGTEYIGGSEPLDSTVCKGSVGFFAELPFVVSNTQEANIWNAFRYAWESTSAHTETSDVRYARILAWAGWVGPTRLDAGACVAYGPATDLTGGTGASGGGTDALTALQNVVDTEAGQHYIAGDGVPVFKARTARYNQAPVVTFGEHAGEVPYLDATTDKDPTRIANDVTATAQTAAAAQASTVHVNDPTSIGKYGTVTLSRTVNTLDAGELTDAAEYLVYQNKDPWTRLEQLPVDVGANPALWATLLPLELGACATFNRRPSNAPTITLTCFVEQITWTFDEAGRVSWTGQLSNSAHHQFAQLDSATYGLLDSTFVLGY